MQYNQQRPFHHNSEKGGKRKLHDQETPGSPTSEEVNLESASEEGGKRLAPCLVSVPSAPQEPTDPDQVVGSVSTLVQAAEGGLQGAPSDCLATARVAHNHGGVTGVLGLVQLDHLDDGEGGHLQPHFPQFQLQHFIEL